MVAYILESRTGLSLILSGSTYININYSIIVSVCVTCIPHPVSVGVLLARVGDKYTVVLKPEESLGHHEIKKKQRLTKNSGKNPLKMVVIVMDHLFAVRILALKVSVRVGINVSILPTSVAIASPSNLALGEKEGFI